MASNSQQLQHCTNISQYVANNDKELGTTDDVDDHHHYQVGGAGDCGIRLFLTFYRHFSDCFMNANQIKFFDKYLWKNFKNFRFNFCGEKIF